MLRVRSKCLSITKQNNNVRYFSPTAESFGVSAQIGSGVVKGGPEVRFHEGSTKVDQGSTRVPPGFYQGSTRVPAGFHEVLRGLGGASTRKSTACCWGYHLSLFPEIPKDLSTSSFASLGAPSALWQAPKRTEVRSGSRPRGVRERPQTGQKGTPFRRI